MHMQASACICMHMKAYACINAWADACVGHAYVCICMRMHAGAGIRMPLHAYACICMHMHANACICMHMHANSRSQPPTQTAGGWETLTLAEGRGGSNSHSHIYIYICLLHINIYTSCIEILHWKMRIASNVTKRIFFCKSTHTNQAIRVCYPCRV